MTGNELAPLSVPEIERDTDALAAALAYAREGWYVGPVRPGDKSPKLLGDHWAKKTSRDLKVIVSWYAGANYGVFLHAGRSGAVVIDVDDPGKLHSDIVRAIDELRPPFQSTRTTVPGRGHYIFLQPPGRNLGNSVGTLGKGWGDIRGCNGVIVVAPSDHASPDGRYE